MATPDFRRLLIATLAATLGTAAVSPASAQQSASSARIVRSRPTALATFTTSTIHVDGRLDDAAWAAAVPLTTFTQQSPTEGTPPSERTDVRILYDDHALYIGARMYDRRGAAGVTSRLARRDDDPQSDELIVDIDAYHDRLNAAEFAVSPAGWRGDSYDRDASWDPVWEAATHVDSLGWTAELRIPFNQLRFSRDSLQTWGLEITRLVYRTQERDQWSFWRKDESGGVAFYGDLTGLRLHVSPERLQLLPYIVTRDQSLGSVDPASPFARANRSDIRAGGDLQYLLSSNFTLNATVNPDFGQVEVDPAVVNLTAFETFFPEKRPFFVEGSNQFDFGSPGCHINCGLGLDLFYSRRIGRAPEGASLAYDAGQYADVPDNTTILGAAKVTGRTANGFSLGMLDAVTGATTALASAPNGTTLHVPVAPATNDFAARATKELLGGNLVLGGLATSVNRRIDDQGLASLLPSSAQTGGVDVLSYWDQHNWHFYGAVSASRLSGDSLAILRVQQSSAHYFQRPDRVAPGGLFSNSYNPSATNLAGYGAIARLAKDGGRWIGDLNLASVSPGYETNDLGYLRKADFRWVNGTVGRQYTTPSSWYRSLVLIGGAERYWNFEGDVTQTDATAVAELETLGYWNALLVAERVAPSMDDRATRGGPVVAQPGGMGYASMLSTDSRKPLQFALNLDGGRGDDASHNESLTLSATVKPAPNVTVSLGPQWSRATSTAQYVATVADPTATAFGGNRYVFAYLDERQLAMTARASVTFTPGLSLDLFAQPLIASGGYTDFEEFAAPRVMTKLIYGRDVGTITSTADGYTVDPDGSGPAAPFTIGNPDFNFRSLRGTGVLRWEWRPGSTAYLVWTQTRSGVAPFGDLQLQRDEQALFRTPADNVFVLKISYWLGM